MLPLGEPRDQVGVLSVELGVHAQVVRDERAGQRAEAHPLAARDDRRQQRVRRGRHKHEVRVGARLLEGLQERVRGRGVHALGVVQHHDAARALVRLVAQRVLQLSDLLNLELRLGLAVVLLAALEDVQIGVSAGGGSRTAVALTTGVALGHRRARAQERLSQRMRRERLTDAIWAAEQVGVVDPVAGERALQRLDSLDLTLNLGQRHGRPRETRGLRTCIARSS